MAHIFQVAAEVEAPYANGRKNGDQVKFPTSAAFQQMNKPCRLEGEIHDLEVTGTVPPEINGTFYRIQPDPQYPPIFEDDIHFNGDGSVTAIQIKDGHVNFKQRYVRTERWKAERKFGKAMFGLYRNPFTDNEAVKGVIRTVSNTNIIFWRGMLLATKEDGPPHAMDPETLETIGRYDFEGQVLTPTFTAHPKFDPKTGEMICFGYEAGGNGHDESCDIVVYTIAADGKKTEETWYKAPFCGVIHDCGLSDNYVVLPMTPLKCSLDRLKKGGHHWAWDPNEDQWYGIVPRRGGKPEDIKWFRSGNAFHGHVAGCYENEKGNIVFDLTIADGNVFFFFPEDNLPAGSVAKRNQLKSDTMRWEFDYNLPDGSHVEPTVVWDTSGEFSRIDDRYVTMKYNHFWQAKIDGSRPYDFQKCGPPAGGLFNCLGHYTWDERTEDVYWAGPTTTLQEPAFIPKTDGGEGEGWIIALANRLEELRNDVVIFDAQEVAKGPIAVIHLPLKLRLGYHGNFVDNRDIEEWKQKRAEDPVRPASEPLPWQKSQANGANGTNGTAH